MKPAGNNRPLIVAQAGIRRDVTTIFTAALAQMRTALIRYAGADGQIRDERSTRLEIRQIVSDIFTDRDEHPFKRDGVTAAAPYPRVLNRWLVFAVYQAVKQEQSWLKRNVPEDVFRYLQSGSRRSIVSEQVAIFEPNPLAEIDPSRQWVPPHKWTDERGYRLSDRIWRTDMETRRKIDEILAKGLQEGKGALELAQALEAYLLPGREGIRTLMPYGRRFMPGGASYDAMRLARTEIARAFNEAAFVSGYVNPYTEAVEVARSANGDPTCPICPEHATLGMAGERLRPAYPKNSADISPFHPHCLCFVYWTVTDTPGTVTAELRQQMLDSQAELGINPASAWAFTSMLLEGALMELLPQLGIVPAQGILF